MCVVCVLCGVAPNSRKTQFCRTHEFLTTNSVTRTWGICFTDDDHRTTHSTTSIISMNFIETNFASADELAAREWNSAMITAHKYISRNILDRSKRKCVSNLKDKLIDDENRRATEQSQLLSFSVLPRRQIYLYIGHRLGIDLLHILLCARLVTFSSTHETAFGTQELINRFEFIFCILLSATAARQTTIHRIRFDRNAAVD